MTGNTKRIVISEKGSDAFYREVVNAAVQYRALLKKPAGKLKDFFKFMKGYGILCCVLLVIVLVLGILWGFDALDIVGIIVCGGALLVCLRYYTSMKKLFDEYRQDERSSVLVMDEAGVEIDKEDGQVMRMAWSNVAFVRTFQESVCFVSKGPAGLIISAAARFQPEIYQYLKENRIDVYIV